MHSDKGLLADVPDGDAGSSRSTFRTVLLQRAKQDPDHPFLVWDGGRLTIGELHRAATKLANAFLARGLKKGDIVALMLDQHAEHIIILYACAFVGLVRTSLNVNAKGDYLTHFVADAKPSLVIAENRYRGVLSGPLATAKSVDTVWRHDGNEKALDELAPLIESGAFEPPPVDVVPDDPLVINYTSGTTGAPKKFMRSDRVVRIGSDGCLMISEATAGDVWLFWEPLYHGSGHQTVFAACLEKITLALVPRFSASQFWDQVRAFGVTKVHYIGGVLPILLKQPARENDRVHTVSVAWGAGCPADTAEEFTRRFGVKVNEGYGLSEVANYVAINVDGPRGSVGRALPWFVVKIVDDEERDVAAGTTGEIVVKGKKPGFTSVSLNARPVTTVDGWIKTGDRGWMDDDGHIFFAGRKSDSLRRRGENISAWEVERIVSRHPAIEECALIGVDSGLGAGDDDLKIFVKPRNGAAFDELELIRWCEDRMPYFQIPRYVERIAEFPKTPSERIMKAELSRNTDHCWDLQQTGYSLKR